MANSFKTELPAQLLCQFHLFSQLPRELQQMVMMENVADPGVHFLKLEDHPGINFENMWVRTRDFPKADPGFDALFDGLMFDVPSSLKPQASRNSNDRSWYMAVREHLSRVMRVDGSILDYVDSVIFLQGVSRLTYDTRLTMLPRTNDLVCIEYVHRNLYNHGFSFSCFYHCEKLREIKRVALRFSHEWTLKSNGRGLCPGCGGYHKHLAGKRVLPRHVYQFLARSFPSLEEVWFIDYRMTPKEAGADHVSLNKGKSSQSLPHPSMTMNS